MKLLNLCFEYKMLAILQFLPILESRRTWAKCQILVPFPMASLSTTGSGVSIVGQSQLISEVSLRYH